MDDEQNGSLIKSYNFDHFAKNNLLFYDARSIIMKHDPNLTMEKNSKIFICTLYSGENEYFDCLASLQAQDYPYWKHKIIKNLPKKEAHEKLYKEFMNNKDQFDLFLKLDADMVLIRNSALRDLVQLFQNYPDLDNAELVVHDWFTNTMIWGIHMFSNRAIWNINRNKLFTDRDPWIPGRKIKFSGPPAPVVYHSPNPNPYQAYHFGIHRGMKAIIGASRTNWQYLTLVWDHYLQSRDPRLGLTLLGAEDVIKNKITLNNYNYTDSHVIRLFKRSEKLSNEKIYRLVRMKWKFPLVRQLRYFINLKIQRLYKKIKF